MECGDLKACKAQIALAGAWICMSLLAPMPVEAFVFYSAKPTVATVVDAETNAPYMA